MTSPQAAAPPSVQKPAARRARLRQASLAIFIVLIIQFALGIGVNLYTTLPAAGQPGHNSFFGNGALLAIHAALGMFLVLAAIFVLVRAIIARIATLIVTSVAGLAAIVLAAVFGSGFTDKLTDGYSLGMALAMSSAVAGTLRIKSPYEFGAHHAGPVAIELMDRYPDLAFRIDVEHEIVSPVAENYDIVFAMLEQPLPSTGIVIRRVSSLERGLYAAPA